MKRHEVSEETLVIYLFDFLISIACFETSELNNFLSIFSSECQSFIHLTSWAKDGGSEQKLTIRTPWSVSGLTVLPESEVSGVRMKKISTGSDELPKIKIEIPKTILASLGSLAQLQNRGKPGNHFCKSLHIFMSNKIFYFLWYTHYINEYHFFPVVGSFPPKSIF